MQYYTALTSFIVQLPALLFMIDYSEFWGGFNRTYLLCCVVNGVFFHFQTISAYVLMDFISPVTHRQVTLSMLLSRSGGNGSFNFSVANTAKRALLIWLSVILFGNPITLLSGLGTVTVIAGVLLYNKAREIDTRRKYALLPPLNFNVEEAHDS